MSRKPRWFLLIPLVSVGIALFVFIGREFVMHLWNWLLPPLFGLPRVTFWQGLGLLLLCRILFGGFGMNSSGGSKPRISDEEKVRFRSAMGKRFGFCKSDSDGTEDEATSSEPK